MIHEATELLAYDEARTLCGQVVMSSYSTVQEGYVTCDSCRTRSETVAANWAARLTECGLPPES